MKYSFHIIESQISWEQRGYGAQKRGKNDAAKFGTDSEDGTSPPLQRNTRRTSGPNNTSLPSLDFDGDSVRDGHGPRCSKQTHYERFFSSELLDRVLVVYVPVRLSLELACNR